MRKIHVIGIGAGDPDQLTVQAVKALRQVDVFFLLDKGAQGVDLLDARREILRRHVEGEPYRLVEARDPERVRGSGTSGYPHTVEDWRSRRADLYERLIEDELGDRPGGDRIGAFLVWGDPGLYDATLGVLEEVRGRGTVRFGYEVIPGVSSVSALVARHRIPLNRVGGAVQITTGRRLSEEGWPAGVDDVVVMLDAHRALGSGLIGDPVVHWGAYLGTEDEILVSGRLSEVGERISGLRTEARARKGWIMDIALLRRD